MHPKNDFTKMCVWLYIQYTNETLEDRIRIQGVGFFDFYLKEFVTVRAHEFSSLPKENRWSIIERAMKIRINYGVGEFFQETHLCCQP